MNTPTPILLSKEVELLRADRDGCLFKVEGTDEYYVNLDDEEGNHCTCPDFYYRKRECKHIHRCNQLIKPLKRWIQ